MMKNDSRVLYLAMFIEHLLIVRLCVQIQKMSCKWASTYTYTDWGRISAINVREQCSQHWLHTEITWRVWVFN